MRALYVRSVVFSLLRWACVFALGWIPIAHAQSTAGLQPLFEFRPVNGSSVASVINGAGTTTASSPFRALLQGLPSFNFADAGGLSADGGRSEFEALTRGRFYSPSDNSGDVAVRSAGRLALQDGVYVPVDVDSRIPKRSALRAIGGALGTALPYVGMAVGVYELVRSMDKWSITESPGGPPLLSQTVDSQDDIWIATGAGGQHFQATTAQAACLAAAASLTYPPGYTYQYGGLTPSQTSCVIAIYDQSGAVWSVTNPSVTRSIVTMSRTEQRTPAQWESAASAANLDPGKLAAATAAAVAAGKVVDVIPKSITGPAETPQRVVSVTSNPDGGTTTTRSKDRIVYNPSPIPAGPTPDPSTPPNPYGQPSPDPQTDWGPSTTVTNITSVETCTNGSCNTTETQTEKVNPTPTPNPAPSTPPAESDLCKLHPEIVACKTLGEPVDPGKIPDKKIEVKVTPVAFAGAGSCPAPVAFTAFGQPYAFEYTPLCNWLIYVKGVIMAIAAVLAAYILADTFRLG